MKKNFFSCTCSLMLSIALLVSLTAPAMAEETTPPPPTAFSIKLPTEMALTLGTDGTLTAEIIPEPEGANLDKVTWEWSISGTSGVIELTNKDQQTVNLKPIKAGNSTVTVKATAQINSQDVEKSVSCPVVVSYAPATDVTLSPSTLELDPREEWSLTANVFPSTADPNAVTWTSDKSNVALLSHSSGPNVTVNAGKAGEAIITASTKTGNPGRCNVTVRGIALSEESLTLSVGGSKQLVSTCYGGIGNLVEWSSGNESVAFVSQDGMITPQSVGKTIITASVNGYSSSCEVTVKENTANTITGSADAGLPFQFTDIRSELNSCSLSVLGETLSYVTNLSVSTQQGILYYGYASPDDTGFGVGGTERYYYSDSVPGQRSLSGITFIPNPDFSGTTFIRYTGYGSSSKSFTGSIRLEVKGSPDVIYTTAVDTPLTFQAADFSVVCRERTGRDMSYVTFDLPTTSRGTLYYNYDGQGQYTEEVSSKVQYNRTRSPYLDSISFVPAAGRTGTVQVGYYCVDTSGSAFRGHVTITITGKSTTGTGDVRYSVNQNGKVTFQASDFNNACRDINGESLRYLRFELPDSDKGTLYYNYSSGDYESKVSDTTRYYRSGSPSISNITFVPKRDFSGSVSIDFSGYDADGDRFDGTVYIAVDETDGRMLRYSVANGNTVTFDAADFNSVCRDWTGETLNYVRFDLPSSSRGVLYYKYNRSSGSYSSKVSGSTSYYRSSGSKSLDDVTFVPNDNYSGIVEISFTGWSTSGDRFTGTVEIQVDQTDGRMLRYSVANGNTVTFDATDFNSVCRDRTGETLNYVRFELPSTSRGALYYKYNKNNGSYSSKVSESTSYYRSSSNQSLDDVTFVPNENYTGTVEIGFTAWSTGGDRFTGTVEIQVTASTASVIRYHGSAAPIPLQVSDFRSACDAVLGHDLSYVQFTNLPDSSTGRLYMGNTYGKAASPVTTGRSYYTDSISQIHFVPKAGFQGTTTIRYTGVDTRGGRFSSTVEIMVSNNYCTTPFTDLQNHGWAKPSIEFLRQSGITSGFTDTTFGPNQLIRRGDFTLMLCRAFQLHSSSTASFPDVPQNSYYGWAVATAKDYGIAYGNQGLFLPNDPITRQDAMVMISRAMDIVGLYTPQISTAVLSSYVDGNQVSSYAKNAVSSLVQLGVVSGNNARQLCPKDAITRAEMAAILYRVLTL